MSHHGQEHKNGANNTPGFLFLAGGLLVGGLVGAGTMLLLAPQSGKELRAQIQQKSLELRDQTTEAVDGAMAQARTKAHQINSDIHEKAKELEQRGQALFDEQKQRFSTG